MKVEESGVGERASISATHNVSLFAHSSITHGLIVSGWIITILFYSYKQQTIHKSLSDLQNLI